MSKAKKNILILGGFGFIGKNLIDELSLSGDYNILVFDSYSGDVGNSAAHLAVKSYRGDCSNENDLRKVFQEHRIDIVVHLVSTTVPASSSGSGMVYDIESNLVPTIKLLGLMKEYGVNKIVFASSGGTVYGLPQKTDGLSLVREDHPNSPICSHGIVKLTIEKYLHMYQYMYGIDYLVLRISNPYGEYHSSKVQGLINVALKKIISGQPVIIWGDGEIVRDYIYIKDCVRAIRLLIEKGISNEVLNVGAGVGYSVNAVLEILRSVSGDFEVRREASRRYDVPRVVLDISKLRSILDLETTKIEIGIRKTYKWLLKK